MAEDLRELLDEAADLELSVRSSLSLEPLNRLQFIVETQPQGTHDPRHWLQTASALNARVASASVPFASNEIQAARVRWKVFFSWLGNEAGATSSSYAQTLTRDIGTLLDTTAVPSERIEAAERVAADMTRPIAAKRWKQVRSALWRHAESAKVRPDTLLRECVRSALLEAVHGAETYASGGRSLPGVADLQLPEKLPEAVERLRSNVNRIVSEVLVAGYGRLKARPERHVTPDSHVEFERTNAPEFVHLFSQDALEHAILGLARAHRFNASEKDVLRLVAQDLSQAEVASALGAGLRTVERRMKSIREKARPPTG